MHILDENKFSNYKEMRGNMTTGKITFDCHWKRMESLVETKNNFCRRYTVQKKKRITHFYFSKYKFCDLPGKIKWPI
jgi:hypothetical protein